jgi:hypothetical protein
VVCSLGEITGAIVEDEACAGVGGDVEEAVVEAEAEVEAEVNAREDNHGPTRQFRDLHTRTHWKSSLRAAAGYPTSRERKPTSALRQETHGYWQHWTMQLAW